MAKVLFLDEYSEDAFLNNKPLYKYLSLEHTLLTLKKGIWFSKPDAWNDPFEKKYYNGEYISCDGDRISFPFKNRIACTCFTTREKSEAYWKTYANESTCAQLSIERKGFLESIRKCRINGTFYIGKMKYIKGDEFKLPISSMLCDDHFDIKNPEDALKLLLRKRKDFEYEEEIRIIFLLTEKEFDDKEKGRYITIDNDIINSIKISPNCGKETFEVLKYGLENMFHIKKRMYKSSKQVSRIMHSGLYEEDRDNIIAV